METLLSDLRYGLRSLLKRPAVFAVATISLALGIAANTTIFAAVDAYLIRPLPYPEPKGIVQIWTSNPTRGWREASNSAPDFRDWRADSRTLDLAAYSNVSYNMLAGDRAERVTGILASPGLFEALRIAPAIGRTFTSDDEREGAPPVVLLSHAFWQRRFAGDRAMVGRSLTLDGVRYDVVGVMPPGFSFPEPFIDLWTPLQQRAAFLRTSRSLDVVGRLRTGATIEAATAELSAIAKRLGATYPEDAGNDVNVVRLDRAIYDGHAAGRRL